MSKLYPLKFNPILLDKIWGGKKLRDQLNKDTATESTGESWEISGVPGQLSLVSNGFLSGNNLRELIEIYMGDLIGDKVYDEFGLDFPLLIKFIDANDDLSIQVHPDDIKAGERHGSFGKTEMWYVVQADPGSKLVSGFRREVSPDEYVAALEQGNLMELLNSDEVNEGDVFFIPAGRVHAIGSGLVIAEIQQSSDVTYRIYDYERKDKDGQPRELHTDMALDVIDFSSRKDYKTSYEKALNSTIELESCPYFTTSLIHFNKTVEKDYNFIDSFVIYMCIEGKVEVGYGSAEKMVLRKGETILVPAVLKELILTPLEESKLLEVYIR